MNLIPRFSRRLTLGIAACACVLLFGLVLHLQLRNQWPKLLDDARQLWSSRLDPAAAEKLDILQAELNELRVLQPTLSREKLGQLQAKVDALRKQGRGVGSNDGGYQPKTVGGIPEASPQSFGAASVALFDGVGPYRKHGLFETYGADLRERRDGPIHVTEAQLALANDEAWVFWSPDYDGSGDATALEVSFAEFPKSGKFTVGFLFADGASGAFTYDTGQRTQPPSGLLAPLVPADLAARASSATDFGPLTRSGDRLVARLPRYIRARLGSAETNRVQQWFVRVQGAAATTVRFKRVALAVPTPVATTAGITLAGRVDIPGLQLPADVELSTENNVQQRQQTSTDGSFRFEGVNPDVPVTIRLRDREFDYHATLGRWFIPGYSRGNILVTIPKTYVNPDGHAPDSSKAKFLRPRKPIAVPAYFESHSRQYWPGAGQVQEYDATTFANNWGFIDRDRFEDNPDHCERVASAGGSDTVALQVRPFEKYNILLEERLGVLLGRCVEVISAGRDNGDLGANYLLIKDYFAKFGATFTLVSTMPALVWQLQPQMLRDGLGWEAATSPIDSFQYDAEKTLKFVPSSPVWSVFITKPALPEYTKGVAFSLTLMVPLSEMSEPGLSAFSYLRDIYKEISRLQPEQRLVVQTGLDQAQCRQSCRFELPLPDGRRFPAGGMIFDQNLQQLCRENEMRCISPRFSSVYGEPDKHLTFEFDSHYSRRGHQWLAAELAPLVADLLKTESGK